MPIHRTAIVLSGLTRENIIVGEGTEFELKGELIIPEDKGPFRAVVLVQGSGPQDMDEKVGVNRTFWDLSNYLGENGIASIRYDKRTLTYGQKMVETDLTGITVEEETIQDAILAKKILMKDDRIDKNKIFIIGHSLGGMLAPRIDAEGGDFAGIVILSGSPRNLSDIIIDQNVNAIAALPEEQRAAADAQFKWLLDTFDKMMDMTDEEAKSTMLGNVALYYLKEMNEHPAESYLNNMTKPILIMQGDKDFHVFVDKDFNGYRRMLEGKKNVAFKLYPGLSHLYNPSIKGTIEDYNVKADMDKGVLKDITEWIKTQ